jgi:hypothetical protein
MNISVIYAKNTKIFVDLLAYEIFRVLNCRITIFDITKVSSLLKSQIRHPAGTETIVVILSKELAASEWCQAGMSEQFNAVKDHGTAVFNILVEDCKLPKIAQTGPVVDFRKFTLYDLGSLAIKVAGLSACNKTITA